MLRFTVIGRHRERRPNPRRPRSGLAFILVAGIKHVALFFDFGDGVFDSASAAGMTLAHRNDDYSTLYVDRPVAAARYQRLRAHNRTPRHFITGTPASLSSDNGHDEHGENFGGS